MPGAEVMTQHGIYGTLISIDDEKNEAIIETTPGTRLRVHRQTVARVVDPIVAEEDVIDELDDDAADAPAAETVERDPCPPRERRARSLRRARRRREAQGHLAQEGHRVVGTLGC